MKQLSVIMIAIVLIACNANNNHVQSTGTDTLNMADTAVVTAATDDDSKPDAAETAALKHTIEMFKTGLADSIATVVSFPLQRQYPIPEIKDKTSFKARMYEVFDSALIQQIAASTMDQYSRVGWRGTMFGNGDFWMTNSDGIINVVNHQSSAEIKLREAYIAKEKLNLHQSLQNYISPLYHIKTKHFIMRIDETEENVYRLAYWKAGAKESSKPEKIIGNGVMNYDGTGGNHDITFTDGTSTYKIYRNIMGEADMPDFTLEISDNGKIRLEEDGSKLLPYFQ